MSAAEAMHSVRMRCDSGTKPRPTWLTRNAGLSVHSTGSRVMRRPSAIMASVTDCAVRNPGITSTSRISGTGLKKCMPPTRSGCFSLEAIAVMGMDDVLEARIVSGRVPASSLANSACLASSCSMMASITTSALAASAKSLATVMRSMAALASVSGSRPFSTSPASVLAI